MLPGYYFSYCRLYTTPFYIAILYNIDFLIKELVAMLYLYYQKKKKKNYVL